jgi:crotonobetainyl-CoA:carnitine CoA-transferase CaiB-like acyl-CoA transferase
MQSRGLYRQVPTSDGTGKMTTGLPWRDETGWKGKLSSSPALGEHNEYVFLELLGMSEQEYKNYQAAGVIA